jgi:hypothetical protein
VNDPLLVHIMKCFEQITEDVIGALNGYPVTTFEHLAEVLALHQFHYQVRDVTLTPNVVDADDSLVNKLARRLGLVVEPRFELAGLLGGHFVQQDGLDCDLAPDARVFAAIDVPHPALADGLDNLVSS